MSEKGIRLRIDGRGEFEGISKDLESDMIVAYIMNFVDDTVETEIAVFGSYELDREEMARQLGKISAHMIKQAFEGDVPDCWRAFERGWKDEANKIAGKHVEDLLMKLGDLLRKDREAGKDDLKTP